MIISLKQSFINFVFLFYLWSISFLVFAFILSWILYLVLSFVFYFILTWVFFLTLISFFLLLSFFILLWLFVCLQLQLFWIFSLIHLYQFFSFLNDFFPIFLLSNPQLITLALFLFLDFSSEFIPELQNGFFNFFFKFLVHCLNSV